MVIIKRGNCINYQLQLFDFILRLDKLISTKLATVPLKKDVHKILPILDPPTYHGRKKTYFFG